MKFIINNTKITKNDALQKHLYIRRPQLPAVVFLTDEKLVALALVSKQLKTREILPLTRLCVVDFTEAGLPGGPCRVTGSGAAAAPAEGGGRCAGRAEPAGPQARRPAHRQRREEPLPCTAAGPPQTPG